jgi:hypothetical protein
MGIDRAVFVAGKMGMNKGVNEESNMGMDTVFYTTSMMFIGRGIINQCYGH